MENGWKMKPLHRLIVTSRTYRLRSHVGNAGRVAGSDRREGPESNGSGPSLRSDPATRRLFHKL